MKIVLVHNTYQQRGGEDVVFEQERRMLEFAGHHVVAYHRSNHEIGKLNILGQIDLARHTVWSGASRAEFDALLAREEPDIVHVHNTFMVISPSIYSACRDRDIPVVQTLHNFRWMCPAYNLFRDNKPCEDCIDHSLWRAIQHRCYRDSTAASATVALMIAWHRFTKTLDRSVACYIALTEFSREKFIAASFPAEKIVVKPNFLETDPGPRQQAGEYALFMGRFSPDKGVSSLLKAWEQLPERFPLQIVGEGPEREALEASVRQRGIRNVTFRGYLSRDEVIATMKNARFLVMPSLWYETFGMVIVEAFACGVPVICSRLGAMKEIVHDQRTGLHFTAGDSADLAQKVEWAWNHPAEIAAMGREGRRQYEERYTAKTNYEMLSQIYQNTLQARAPTKSGSIRRERLQLSKESDVA
jgi:glycosyltransferase involved in cell wall biosynthesis